MNTMKCIKFGRDTAKNYTDLSLYEFTVRYIQQYDLSDSYSDLLYTLANASSIPESYIVPYTTLIQYGILPRSSSRETKSFLNAYGIKFRENTDSESQPRLVLGWEGIIQCFNMIHGPMKSLIDHAPMVFIAYDSYEQQLVIAKAIDHIIILEDRIRDIQDSRVGQLVHPMPNTIPTSPEYNADFEWDDFLNQMVRIDRS